MTGSGGRQPPRLVDGVHWADLDGLRALAILLVLARHSLRPLISEDAWEPVVVVGSFDLTPLFLNGWSGVDLFFVLSGFLIGRQAWRGSDGFGRFWFKRATRILPAYWTCLACIAVWLTATGAWSGTGTDFLAHVVMLQDYTGSVFVPAFWSLGAEEKFYLLAPVLVLLLSPRLPVRWQAAALAVVCALPVAARAVASAGVGMPLFYDEYFPLYRSPFHLTCEALALGFLIAWASLRLPRPGRPVREMLFWGGAAVLAWWSLPAPILETIDRRTIVWAPVVLGLAFGALTLAAIGGRGSYSRVLGWRGWRVVAVGSYSIYLTHMMVLPFAVALSVRWPVGGPSLTGQWLSILPWYLAFSIGSAWALHRGVEAPALAWRARVLRDWRGSGPPRSAGASS